MARKTICTDTAMKGEIMATSKKAKVLKHLQQHKKGITGVDALRLYGLYRLSEIIRQLRESGIDIKTEMMTRENEDGTTTRFARYYL